MKTAAALIVCIVLSLAAGLLSANDTSFRCGNDLIQEGYTMYQVKNSCGAPDSEQVVSTREITRNSSHGYGKNKVETTVNVTEWIYGRDSGIYILTFDGDRLVRKEYRKTD